MADYLSTVTPSSAKKNFRICDISLLGKLHLTHQKLSQLPGFL